MALTNSFVNNDSLQVENQLFPNLCRVCMSYSKDMNCIFSSTTTRLVEDLEFCTGILISKEDGLPTKLCESCLSSLAIAYKFKSLCLRSDNFFRKLILDHDLPKETSVIMKKIDEVTQVDVRNSNFQALQIKHEIDSDDDDRNVNDNILCAIQLPKNKPTTRTRLKNKKESIIDSTRGQKKRITNNRVKPKLEKKRKELKMLCSVCHMKFDSKEELIEHRTNQHLVTEWICEICGKTFKYRSSHYAHIRSHLPPTEHCEKCDYKTWHKADLKKHQRLHNDDRPFVCEYCTKAFFNTSNLHDHIRRSHTASRKKYPCLHCDKTYYDASKLTRHVDSHNNVKRFECEVCHQRFARRCRWKIHLKKNHNISIPKVRPGRPKRNVLIGIKGSTTDNVNL